MQNGQNAVKKRKVRTSKTVLDFEAISSEEAGKMSRSCVWAKRKGNQIQDLKHHVCSTLSCTLVTPQNQPLADRDRRHLSERLCGARHLQPVRHSWN